MASEPSVASPEKIVVPPVAWRLALWGAAALIALCVMLVAALSDSGAARLQALAAPPPATPVVAQIQKSPDPSPDIVKLTDSLRTLTADRERLNARLATLEQMLEDVTGSIKRQTAAAESARTPPPAAPASPAPAIAAPAPAIAAPATVASAGPPPVEPVQPAAAVPLPPERMASVDAIVAPENAPKTESKTEIGIDLGGASSPEALRAHWAALKANLGPLLGPLRPVMVMREAKPGAPPYRLIMAPLPSNNAAVQVCARLAATKAFCRPTSFMSQSAALL